MKKYCLAAAAALCAVMMTACGAENEAPADTSAQSETESVTESVSETVSETEAASSEETTVSETEETTETSETKEAFTCADIVAEIENTVELPSMADIGADRVHMYLDFEIPEGCDFAMSICGSGGFADEIFVIDASDIDEAALEAAVEKRITAREKDSRVTIPMNMTSWRIIFQSTAAVIICMLLQPITQPAKIFLIIM